MALGQVAENIGPVWPMTRALSHTAAAEFDSTFAADAWSTGCCEAAGDCTQRASSRTATPLKDGQSVPLQLVSQSSDSTGAPPAAAGLTCAVISRAAEYQIMPSQIYILI